LFLDEIADLPLSMQVKLLRVIQEKKVRPVGSHTEQPIDVRIISASHKNLENMVKEGVFRQDLYYRVNVIGIRVPPLCERADDVATLTDYIIKKHNLASSTQISLSTEAAKALKMYPFPGNVRELENILERAAALCEDDQIKPDDLQLPEIESRSAEPHANLGHMTENLERDQITSALEASRWNQSAAARSLGITLRQLRYKIEKMNLDKP
jgi:two-component system response regulator PilR (NtrC family)